MFERLSGEFNRGYTKAIVDIEEAFPHIIDDLTHHHKRITYKLVAQFLHCCLANRESLRENVDGFIRYNKQKDDFEFYIPKLDGYTDKAQVEISDEACD